MAKKQIDPYAVFDEHQIQVAIFRAFKKRRVPGSMLWAIPNGMKRDRVTAKRLKDEGCRKGATDLIGVLDGQTFFIEVKTLTGSLDDDQEDFHAELARAGGLVCTVYGYMEAVGFLEEIGMIRPSRAAGAYHGKVAA